MNNINTLAVSVSVPAIIVAAALYWFFHSSRRQRLKTQKLEWNGKMNNRLNQQFELLETLITTYDKGKRFDEHHTIASSCHGRATVLREGRKELLRRWNVKQPTRLLTDVELEILLDTVWDDTFDYARQVDFVSAYMELKSFRETQSFS